MKRCPVCRRVYGRQTTVCPVDTTALGDTGPGADALVGQTITPRYRVIRKLGASGVGTVYLAQEVATGTQLAVKVLASDVPGHVDLVKQSWWEARLAAASDPARIVRVHEIDRTDDGRVFVAMEYLEGESLAELIRRQGALPPARALRLAIQIAQGLAAASQAGVIHRNLKPQNVLIVGPDEQVKLTDFGIRCLLETAPGGRPGRTASEYLAPEQLTGEEVSYRADIYALGAVLYTMLTGAPPTPSSQEPAPMRMLRPDIPQALDRFVMRAMERRPDRRPGGMQEVIETLRSLVASETVPDEVAPSGLLALLREEPQARASRWRESLAGWQRLRELVGRLQPLWPQLASPAARRVGAGATALAIAGVATWAIVDWSSRTVEDRAADGRLQARELENERRREEARAVTAELHRRMQAAAERRAEERRRQRALATARTALLRVEAQPPARSAEELFRIRSEVQQKLFSRGLFRVSAGDPWGVTLELGPRGEVILSGLLPDMARYNQALQLVREVPGVGEVRAGELRVAEQPPTP